MTGRYLAGSMDAGAHVYTTVGESNRTMLASLMAAFPACSHAAWSANVAVVMAGCRQKLMPKLALLLITTISIHCVISHLLLVEGFPLRSSFQYLSAGCTYQSIKDGHA